MSTQTASNKDLTSSLGDIFSSKPSSPSSNTYEPGSPFSSGSSDSSDVSSMASGMSWQTILIIILILALLGFNIFIYLAKGTGAVAEFIDKYFGPLLKLFGVSILETTKQTIDISATGTKAGVDAVANTATGTIDVLEQGKKSSSISSRKRGSVTVIDSTRYVDFKKSSGAPANKITNSSYYTAIPLKRNPASSGFTGTFDYSMVQKFPSKSPLNVKGVRFVMKPLNTSD
jgi:hypothetical protein